MSTTHLKSKQPSHIMHQAGVSVVTAIFLIVILALMGVGMVSILTTSQQSISQEITSAKAYMAARSCLQWGMYQAVYPVSLPPALPLTFPLESTNRFTSSGLVNTRCEATNIDIIDTDNMIFYNITATGQFGNLQDPEYSERTLRLQMQP